MLLSCIRFELGIVISIVNSVCILNFRCELYVLWCILFPLIMYDLGCKVDLLRLFVVLNGLPGLYKWRYVRVNVFNGDRRT
jgi:hypothetical protein